MLFAYMTNAEVIDFAAFRECTIANLFAIFWGCNNLKSIDLSPFTITYNNWYDLQWSNVLFNYCYKLEYLNLGNLYNTTFTHLWYQYKNLGRDSDKYLVIDNLFDKAIKTGANDNVDTWIRWTQAFVRNNVEILDFTTMDWSEMENIQYRGIYLYEAFQNITAKEIHFPDTKFYIANAFYTFGSNNFDNKPLEYINFGGATFMRNSNDILYDKIDYIFTYMNNLKKIRCTQETKDFILEANKTRPLFMPSIFVDNDDAWEIWDK